MGAPDVLQHLQDAGLHLALLDGKIIVQPRSKLTDDLRQSIKDNRDKLLQVLSRPSKAPASDATTPSSSGRPYALSRAESDVAHLNPWDDGAIARFQARVAHTQRVGFLACAAEDLAERLHLRDVHADDRHLCLECRFLAGAVERGWRCRNGRAADLVPARPATPGTPSQPLSLATAALPAELVTMLQHCPGFAEAGP